MSNDKCGIYQITCTVSGKSYVGSSRRIYRRWNEHSYLLRRGLHKSPRLQQAWNKHGEANFAFSVLEECAVNELFAREQHWIDLKKRDYNSMPRVRVITAEMKAKMKASRAARALLITHCPHGHEYTPENSYFGKRPNDKRCRACANERTSSIYAAETPEQTVERLRRGREYHQANIVARRAKQREYAARTKEVKRLYDIAYRPIKNAARRARAAEGNC